MGRYKGYGQVCPLAMAAEVLCERWTLLIIRELVSGAHRFAELRRGIPAISPGMLTQRLRELEDAGVVVRESAPQGRSGTKSAHYQLTAAGNDLLPVVQAMGAWGMRWAMGDFRPEDLDPAYMMWRAHRALRSDALEARRVVIAYEFVDAPADRRRWWIVVEEGAVDLCFKHPGLPIDITVTTKLRPMAELLLGRLSPRTALRQGVVQLEGSRALSRSFARWSPCLSA